LNARPPAPKADSGPKQKPLVLKCLRFYQIALTCGNLLNSSDFAGFDSYKIVYRLEIAADLLRDLLPRKVVCKARAVIRRQNLRVSKCSPASQCCGRGC
jgi:hypothetical protein